MGTHVTEESWFSRIGDAFKGILIGGLLAIVSVPVLFWNEGRAVRTAKGLQEGAKLVIDIRPDTVDSANEGKFVHATGDVQTADMLRDDDFGIEYNGIRLKRHVEMFQWKESEESKEKKNLGGSKTTTTTFTYDKGWYRGIIDSSRFDEADSHQNPTQALFADRSHQAQNVSLGGFRLPDSLIAMIDGHDAVELDETNLPSTYKDRATIRRDGPDGSARIYISAGLSADRSSPQPIGIIGSPDSSASADPNRPELIDLEPGSNTTDAVGGDPDQSSPPPNRQPGASGPPQIGDVRLWFTATPVATVSLLSQQAGESFQPFKTQYGTTINVLRTGVYSAVEMIAQEEAANRTMTWILRAVGTLVMFFGLTLVLRPLTVLADVLPIAGSLVGFGTAVVAGLLTIAGSLTVIGIAWLFYRPLLGISLLAVAAAAIFFILKRGRSQPSQ